MHSKPRTKNRDQFAQFLSFSVKGSPGVDVSINVSVAIEEAPDVGIAPLAVVDTVDAAEDAKFLQAPPAAAGKGLDQTGTPPPAAEMIVERLVA